MEGFSLEHLYLECNVNNHCLGVELKTPIIHDGKEYDELFIIEINLTKEEKELLVKNTTHAYNTYHTKIKALAYVMGQNPFEANEYAIETDNIKAINRIR